MSDREFVLEKQTSTRKKIKNKKKKKFNNKKDRPMENRKSRNNQRNDFMREVEELIEEENYETEEEKYWREWQEQEN